MLTRLLFTFMIAATIFAGCGQSAEEPADTPDVETTAVPEAISTPEEVAEPAEPETPAVALPAALVDLVDISPDFTLTLVETKDEASKQYHIEADTKLNVDKVQNFYMKAYQEKGWAEDMNMSQKGNTITGYSSPDGFLLVVEATKGGKGSLIKIDTGML